MEDIKLKIENLRVFNNKKQTKENVQKLEEQNRIKVKQIQQNELKNSQRATEKYSKLSLTHYFLYFSILTPWIEPF